MFFLNLGQSISKTSGGGGAAPAPSILSNTLSTNFDGTNEYGSFAYDASLQMSGRASWSVSAYIKTTASANQGVVGAWNYTSGDRAWILQLQSNGAITLYASADGSSFTTWEPTSPTPVNSGAWVHVIFTFRESQDALLWINGSSIAVTRSFGSTIATLHSANLGGHVAVSGGGVNFFNGNIDEIALWDGAFDNTTASELYNSGVPLAVTSHSKSADALAWWRMGDGDTHPTISDQVNSNDITLVNSESADFQNNVVHLPDTYSTLFTASNTEYATKASPSAAISSGITNQLTAAAWIKTTAGAGAAVYPLIGMFNSNIALNQKWWFGMLGTAGAAGGLRFVTSADGNSNSTRDYSSAGAVNTGSWVHIAATYNGSGNTIFYINGSSVSSSASAHTSLYNTTFDFRIGSAIGSTGTNFTWDGNVDDAVVFDVELTANEIKELYNTGIPWTIDQHTQAANLVGWWRMGDGDTHPTLIDQMGNDNLTMVNMASSDFVTDVP